LGESGYALKFINFTNNEIALLLRVLDKIINANASDFSDEEKVIFQNLKKRIARKGWG
jgi:hypothetical protein